MINNPFESDVFSMTSLTESINILPNNYGKLEAMNLFSQKSLRTRNIAVEEMNGVLNLLPTQIPEETQPLVLVEKEKCVLLRFLTFHMTMLFYQRKFKAFEHLVPKQNCKR